MVIKNFYAMHQCLNIELLLIRLKLKNVFQIVKNVVNQKINAKLVITIIDYLIQNVKNVKKINVSYVKLIRLNAKSVNQDFI